MYTPKPAASAQRTWCRIRRVAAVFAVAGFGACAIASWSQDLNVLLIAELVTIVSGLIVVSAPVAECLDQEMARALRAEYEAANLEVGNVRIP